MNLRTRLVLALVALTTVGLATFGVTTYSLYKRSQERQLDDQLQAAANGQAGRLAFDARRYAIDPTSCAATADRNTTPTTTTQVPGEGTQPGGPNGGPGPGQFLEGYVELRDGSGSVIACAKPVSETARPDLPTDLGAVTGPRYLTVGSSEGDGQWRALVAPVNVQGRPGFDPDGDSIDLQGGVIVVAARTSGIDASMERLLKIELTAALLLLTALGAGAWLILRAGLRPLEQMADKAATISAGDLSQRVAPADERTEVGQLGLALNTMLDGIELSFQEREATERRLRQFLSDASHELRTPLTSIQGFAELFRLGEASDRPDRPDLTVIMRRIEQESDRMKGLVEDLLLLARLDETRPFEAGPVDLSVVAADSCTDAKAIAPDRTVTLDAPQPVVVRGDANHLRQAVANLVTNALKHTPPGTPVEVATRVQGDRATVTVRDHGPGLEPDALAHVFDRFWQADAARVGQGSGLGLSIVAGIAEEHGGRAVAANAPDGGAVFTIEVPLSGPVGTPPTTG